VNDLCSSGGFARRILWYKIAPRVMVNHPPFPHGQHAEVKKINGGEWSW